MRLWTKLCMILLAGWLSDNIGCRCLCLTIDNIQDDRCRPGDMIDYVTNQCGATSDSNSKATTALSWPQSPTISTRITIQRTVKS